LNLKYTKIQETLIENDNIESWSFGIITNGKKLDSLTKLIESIKIQNIPNYEIIVCGPLDDSDFIIKHNLIVLRDVILVDDQRVPTPQKKNKIIENATYNNLVILHDRFSLPINWYARMFEYGNYFDYLLLKTIDINSNRFNVDWMSFDSNISSSISYKNKALNYNDWSADLIIQGGVIIGKRHIVQKHNLDERLFWEELEDIHFSKLASLYGAFFYLDIKNYIISESINHKPATSNRKLSNVKFKIKRFFSVFKYNIKFKYLLWKNYTNLK
jgi:hypothetical protein